MRIGFLFNHHTAYQGPSAAPHASGLSRRRPNVEVMRALKPKPARPAGNDKPTVMYAPHFDEHGSSWQKMGEAVLAFSKDNQTDDLIFAPHVALLRRRWRHGGRLPRGDRRRPNILNDTSSTATERGVQALLDILELPTAFANAAAEPSAVLPDLMTASP